ncbi:MAG: mitochondrial fission ELM1 family protein [Candidatus Binatia bacterium]
MGNVTSPSRPSRPLPRVWVLFGKGTGGNGQMQSLADALGWPYEIKQLRHNKLNGLPNLLLGATDVTLDRAASSPLVPPWPDLVIAASRRAAPVAQWIRKQSGGRTKLVHLLHVQAPLGRFDLIVTMPQFRLPERDNILHLTGVLNRIDPAALCEAEQAWRPRLAHLPRPWTALLVGGNSSAYLLDAATAARLGHEASRQVSARGGSLLVTTSPRTPSDAADALAAAVDVPGHVYKWKKDDAAGNPYKGFLALADDFIVTIDSASLLVEASATGRPVAVFDWPRRAAGAGAGAKHAGAAPSWLWRKAVDLGLFKPARDFDAYFAEMRRRGLAHRFGEEAPRERQPLDDLEQAVARVRALFDLHPEPGQ